MAAVPTPDIEAPPGRAERESTPGESVGCCNTRHAAKFGRDVFEAGVDTLRLLFKCASFHGPESGSLAGDAARYHWFPQYGLTAVEGHPGRDGTLGRAEDVERCVFEWADLLQRGEQRARAEISGFGGVSRLDATATTRFEQPAEGVALLQGMAALDWPRLKPVVYGKPPETVALTYRNSKGRILARAYDKGLQLGGGRGELVRLEDQRRFPSGRRPLDAMREGFARSVFRSRFTPLWQASKGVRVASLPVLTESVAAMVDRGEMKPARAARLVGFLAIDTTTRSQFPARTSRRYRAELRELGLVVADGFFEPVDVDLAAVLEAALDSPAWGHG